MLRKRLVIAMGLVWLAAPVGSSFADPPQPKRVLGKYMPGDVWLYLNMVSTPSRDFVQEHWNDVLEALAGSGIDSQIKYLLSCQMNREEKKEFEATWSEISSLLRAIHWQDLIENEIAMGERFGGIMPNFVFLTVHAKDTVKANTQALSKLMETLSKLSDEAVFSSQKTGGVSSWSVSSKTAPVSVHLIVKGNILGLVFGQTAANDVIALLNPSADQARPCIAGNQRYITAQEDVPAAGYSVFYVDFDLMLKSMKAFPNLLLGEKEVADTGARTVSQLLKSSIHHAGFLDYVIMTGAMKGTQDISHTCLKTKPSSESLPLYRMKASRKPIVDFHRYLPVETKNFTASSFIDLNILYETILSVVENDLPNGKQLLQDWNAFQVDIGFSIKKDLLDWISGEFIIMTLPPAMLTPFTQEDSVLLLRVKDAQLAKEKLDRFIAWITRVLTEKGQPLAVEPAAKITPGDFRCLTLPAMAMFLGNPCVGVWNEWLVVGSSEESVLKVMRTAAGQHQSIRSAPRFQAEGLMPDGPVQTVSFSDLSNISQELTAAFFSMGFAAGMIPDEPEARPVRAIINMISCLGSAMAEIDFLSSISSYSRIDGQKWLTVSVTTYKEKVQLKEPSPKSK